MEKGPHYASELGLSQVKQEDMLALENGKQCANIFLPSHPH